MRRPRDARYSRRTILTGTAAPLDSDLDILNYALTLEYPEAAAYKAINDAGLPTGRAASSGGDLSNRELGRR